MSYTINETCPILGTKIKIPYIDLGNIPLVNNLNHTREESLQAERFPLSVNLFVDSKLSMLSAIVDPDVLYSNYLYKSGVSQPYIDHCKEMFEFLDAYLFLKEGDKIIDIGGNDGTLLSTFLKEKPYLDVLNVDASKNLTELSNSKGIKAIYAYWGNEFADSLSNDNKLITSTNVFQHTLPIDSFVKGIKKALAPKGIWCLEFPYWKSSMETNQYDQIYHEHVYYYMVEPLKTLFEKNGLMIIKAVSQAIHGGSMRLLISHKGEYNAETGEFWSVDESVEQVIKAEDFNITKYVHWGIQIQQHIHSCRQSLQALKGKIACFGAAAKGCIFLNTLHIDRFDYVVDDTDIKQGKFIPGTGLEVVTRAKLIEDQPDYVLILAHNFKDYIISSLIKDGYKGKFIVCFPKFEII